MNNEGAIFSVVEHLVKLGHTKIGYIANKNPSTSVPVKAQIDTNFCIRESTNVCDTN